VSEKQRAKHREVTASRENSGLPRFAARRRDGGAVQIESKQCFSLRLVPMFPLREHRQQTQAKMGVTRNDGMNNQATDDFISSRFILKMSARDARPIIRRLSVDKTPSRNSSRLIMIGLELR
jgi:hypothetical protein